MDENLYVLDEAVVTATRPRRGLDAADVMLLAAVAALALAAWLARR